MSLASVIVTILGLYLAVGIIFALLFVSLWLERADPVAKGAKFTLRIVLIPAAMGLWPFLAWRVFAAPHTENEVTS